MAQPIPKHWIADPPDDPDSGGLDYDFAYWRGGGSGPRADQFG